MRKLSIDEKVSIKGQLATKGVAPYHLARLNTEAALYFWWRCFGTPISLHSTGKRWRKSLPRNLLH